MEVIKVYPEARADGRKFVGGIYLHGKAHDRTDLFEVGETVYDRFWKMEDGVYDVVICYDEDSIFGKTEKEATMFFWTISGFRHYGKELRGLICLKNDKKAIKNAKGKFDVRSEWL